MQEHPRAGPHCSHLQGMLTAALAATAGPAALAALAAPAAGAAGAGPAVLAALSTMQPAAPAALMLGHAPGQAAGEDPHQVCRMALQWHAVQVRTQELQLLLSRPHEVGQAAALVGLAGLPVLRMAASSGPACSSAISKLHQEQTLGTLDKGVGDGFDPVGIPVDKEGCGQGLQGNARQQQDP